MYTEHCGRKVEGTHKRRCTTMQTSRFIRWAVAAALAALAVTLAGCSGSSSDKAGGTDQAEPRVLTLASPNGGAPPVPLTSWAEEVNRLSGGTLAVEFQAYWRGGEQLYEAGTLEDVKAGKVDMAWVGSRVFDTVEVTSFQALAAPLLIDSYDLEGKVFEEGIPERMLEGVSALDLVGIGVLPGPMRKMLGVSKPFVRPGDFQGEVIGLQDSGVGDTTLRALGATPRAMPTGAELDGLDAYEQHLASIAGNSYDMSAKYLTTNLNLWPRPYVIVMGEEVFESLTGEQQSALRDAAPAVMQEALATERAAEDEAAPILCRRGVTFASASESDLADLRSAFEPVYAELRSDSDTGAYLTAITALKSEIAAAAEAPICDPESGTPASSGFPEGTYESTVTSDDWPGQAYDTGTFTQVFDSGEMTVYQPKTGEIGFRGTYTVFRDQIEVTGPEDTLTARWSFDGERLRFTDIEVCTGSSCSTSDGNRYIVVWGSHPWVRVDGVEATAIDGVYEFTTTVEELWAAGSPHDDVVENYGEHRWVLDGGRFEMTQKNGASDRWTKGTYVVRGNIVVFTVEDYGGVAPTGASEKTGEVFTYTWSLYRDQLTLGAVEGAISPENFRAKPWTRVD